MDKESRDVFSGFILGIIFTTLVELSIVGAYSIFCRMVG
jgi:hypothetical protein